MSSEDVSPMLRSWPLVPCALARHAFCAFERFRILEDFDGTRCSSHYALEAGTFMIVVESVTFGGLPLEEDVSVLPTVCFGFRRLNLRGRHKREDGRSHVRIWV